MKKSSFLFSLILPVFFYTSIESIIQVNKNNTKCWEYPNPFKPWEKISSVCGLQEKKETKRSLKDNRLISTNIIQFNYNYNNIQDQIFCNKIKEELKSAGEIITNLVNFNTPIKVNVTFGDLCKEFGLCDRNILGKAITARTLPLQDNYVKQYPQALVKQFLLEPEPQWGDYDINAYFNLYFDNFNSDFQYIVLSELVHGFESFSGWDNYFSNQIFTPNFTDLIKSSNQS
ncbi:hypothetical protein RclHR1_01620019 [Rhizophagus clarus]|uniref:Uncharacterized protein n=1 Tax=Rhizophagus clarus TaxID=94130 RepID=A0A2Z6QH73_9GLOM|nr:hypothetical protein RclHR1_01620019 [Rhizophagus clarus]